MDFADYALTLLDHQAILTIVFLLLLAFYYFAFYRKLSFNIFDSFTVELISSAGAALGVYVLFVYGNTDKKYLFSFLTCEIALFAAIYLIRYISLNRAAVKASVGSGINLTQKQEEYLKVFFFIVFTFFVILQLISFKLVGLILFSGDDGINHVNAYSDYGPFFSILFVMNPIFAICLFSKRKIFKKFSLFDYGCILLALFSMFTSGSKSSFVTLFTAFAVVDYKFAKLENKSKTRIPAIFLVLLFASIILILQIGSISVLSGDSAVSKLFQRIALSGDGFILGYDDSAIRYVLNGPWKNAFAYILYPLYGRFAVLGGFTARPTIVGTDLYYYSFGIDDAGANGRHNLLSVVFWGPYWGWMLSFLIGSFIGYVRFYLFEKVSSKNIFYLIFICVLAAIVPACITDIFLFNSMLFMLCVLAVFFLVSTVVLYELINIGKAILSHYLISVQLKKQSIAKPL